MGFRLNMSRIGRLIFWIIITLYILREDSPWAPFVLVKTRGKTHLGRSSINWLGLVWVGFAAHQHSVGHTATKIRYISKRKLYGQQFSRITLVRMRTVVML